MIYLAIGRCEDNYEHQHRRAHTLLSSVLEALGYVGVSVKKQEGSRPCVDEEGVDISVSHSGNAVAVAVLSPHEEHVEGCIVLPYNGRRIGIDIEKICEERDLEKSKRLAQRFLNAKISSNEEFYRLWTRNEAYGKMTGEGVLSKNDIPCEILTFTAEIENIKYSLSISIE